MYRLKKAWFCYGVFPLESAGRFGMQRRGTIRVSTAKNGAWPGLSRTDTIPPSRTEPVEMRYYCHEEPLY